MKKERVRSKHGFKGFGSFILGWFIGFICTILIIAGVGYWAYTSLSVKKIEKWTKSDITSNNDLESMTLQDAVAIVKGISKGSNEYTLAKFEEDFGLKLLDDTMYGISMDKVKNSPLKELDKAFNDTIDTATFANILSFMEVGDDLGLLDTVLDSEITYYINNGKLYTDNTYSTEVEFDYTISGTEVEFANGKHTIKSSSGYTIVTPTLEHVPLKTAINQMENVTKDMKIYEIMDYHYDDVTKKYYKTYSNGVYSDAVSGVMNAIADYSIDDLSDQSKIDELEIHEVMGYYYNKADDSYYTTSNFKADTKVASVMNSIAGKQLGDLSKDSTYNNLTVGEVLGVDVDDANNSTIIKALHGKPIGQLNVEIKKLSLGTILGVEKGADGNSPVIDALYDSTVESLNQDINNLTLGQSLSVTEKDATGIVKALYSKKIIELNQAITDLQIYQVMGYYEKVDGDVKTYYLNYNTETKEYSNQVTGIMGAIAGSNVNNLSTTIDTLKAVDVFGEKQDGKYTVTVLNLFTDDELNTDYDATDGKQQALTIMELPNAVVNKLNSEETTIGDLINAKVIVLDEGVEASDYVKGLTISRLIEELSAIM